jgi:capsular exopolysaccharide synthesis family protein
MYSSNNNQIVTSSSGEEEIDFKNLVSTLKRYKLSISIVIITSTVLALLYTLTATKVYQGNLKLEIRSKMYGEPTQTPIDSFDRAFDVKGENLENEMAVLQSHFVIGKAIDKLELSTHYYIDKKFKDTELYKDSPFKVDVETVSDSLKEYTFQIQAIDDKHFQLIIEPTGSMKVKNFLHALFGNIPVNEKLVYFKGSFLFGAPISNALFTLTVNKTGEMTDNHYSFNMTKKDILIENILKGLKVTPTSDKSSVFLMSYEDNVPLRAKDILSAIAEAYQEQEIETKKASAHKALNFIDNQLKNLNVTVKNAANGLEDYKSKHIVMETKDKAVMTAQNISGLEKDKYELEMQEGVYQKLLKEMQENKSSTGLNTGSIITSGTPLLPLFEKLQEANTLRASLLVDYTEQHPSVIKVNKQIDTLKTNLKATIESSLRGIQQRKAILNEIVQKNNQVMQEIPEEENQLTRLTNNFLLDQKNYEYVLQKRAEIAIAESSTVSIVRVIDEALVGELPIKPIPILNLFLGMLLGFIFGIIQAIVRNYFSNTVYTVSDMEKLTSLPLFGILPTISENKTKYDDAMRVLLTKLEFNPLKPKVINMTSSKLGEGRTSTILSLATVMGQSGKKVIVLDLDLFTSSIHKRLNLNNERGISTLLAGKSTLEDVLKQTSFYDIIGAGPIHDNSYGLLMSDILKTLLHDLRGKYDYILLQSPSMDLIADTVLTMRLSDLNLIVFKAQYSKKSFLNNINSFVDEYQIENVGMILNSLKS